MTIQIQKQKPSKTLEQLLADLAPDLGKLKPKVNAIFEQGRKEGLDDMEIGKMVRSKMKEHYSDRTIQRVLPDTVKGSQGPKHGITSDKNDKMSDFERDNNNIELPITYTVQDADVVPEQPAAAPEIPTQQPEPSTSTTTAAVAKSATEFAAKEPEKPGPGEVKGKRNIAPEVYELEHLQEYGKDLLIRIIQHLDAKLSELNQEEILCMKGDLTLFEELRTENATLNKENTELKTRIKNLGRIS